MSNHIPQAKNQKEYIPFGGNLVQLSPPPRPQKINLFPIKLIVGFFYYFTPSTRNSNTNVVHTDNVIHRVY